MRDSDDNWIESVTRFAEGLGMNPVRVRWKLRRLQARWEATRRRVSGHAEHVRYEHRVCPRCTSVQDKDAKVCTRCGTALGARSFEVARRAGVMGFTPQVSVLLGAVMVLAYFRLILAWPEASFEYLYKMDGTVLAIHGSFAQYFIELGQYWRYVTAQFLHIGMVHLGFNLFALSIIGPHVEEMYRRGPTLFFFLLTGVVANMVSGQFSMFGNAGASGALMGLLGLAAARGHLAGRAGHAVRNLMLQWFAITMIFGFVIGADNWAHGGGFVAGGLLGFLLKPRWFFKGEGPRVARALGVVAIAVIAVALAIIMYPPLVLTFWEA